MHVTPSELRTVRQDGIVVRFALLDSMAFVLAEIPSSGSRGTPMEQACVKPHWGFVIAGEILFERGSHRQAISAGSAFHVPAGDPPHRFVANEAARVAGFEPIDTDADTTDSALVAHGFEVLGPRHIGAATVIPAAARHTPDSKEIDARAWLMSSYVLTQAGFGPGSGYTTDWCDAPHWGMVTAGRLAVEWEDDIEILAAGDVYHCPAGPPGHRLEAADPASVIDLTPSDHRLRGRVAPWRQWPAEPDAAGTKELIAVAGLG